MKHKPDTWDRVLLKEIQEVKLLQLSDYVKEGEKEGTKNDAQLSATWYPGLYSRTEKGHSWENG